VTTAATRRFAIGPVEVGNDCPLALIAGPCALESRGHALEMSHALVEIARRLGIGLIYKTSFDKANRTSHDGPRGLGLKESLPILAEVRERWGCPVLTDVHEPAQCAEVAKHVDVLQIPAFLCRQTDLLLAAAATGLAVNVKKGQFLAPWDMANVAAKLERGGAKRILLTERGVSFGYNTLVSDMRALPILAALGHPVVFDATHSVQQPGGQGSASGGDRRFVPVLARGGGLHGDPPGPGQGAERWPQHGAPRPARGDRRHFDDARSNRQGEPIAAILSVASPPRYKKDAP
jgi:2-dehydro-3-deoxyphosphooctonate aldolase (KDO 8-P synthase)